MGQRPKIAYTHLYQAGRTFYSRPGAKLLTTPRPRIVGILT